MRFHDSPPVVKSKKLSTKLFGLCSDESIISHWMILNRYLLFCVYPVNAPIVFSFSYPLLLINSYIFNTYIFNYHYPGAPLSARPK